jgi:hypothetical protein
MQTSRTRLTLASAATLALVIAGTAAVSAHPRDDGPGAFGQGGMGQGMHDMGGRGMGMGPMGGLFDTNGSGFIRSETTYQTDAGTVTQRVDLGTVTATGAASLDYTLATGEAATVTTDDATQVIGFTAAASDVFDRGRMGAEQVALADIPAGAEVAVWAESQADGTYLAQRIVVRPDAQATATDSDDDAASGDAGSGITEVPASPSAAPAA